ncbi:hypothetical protein BGZ83_002243 [Gryganskiella cystojenkinii]|nr:hypothetical protein BGZ83_002243 [Gryganskiella cystojenkinii]
MDVLNAVESAQESLRQLLANKAGGSKPSERQAMEVRVMSLYLLHCLYSYLPIQQNPFLCLFVDIYNLAIQDENLRSERFVTSVILNGKGEELAAKTPSELIALAQKVESKPVNIRMLEDYLPDVPIEDQVQVGLGWDSQQQRRKQQLPLQQQRQQQQRRGENNKIIVETIAGSRHGDENGSLPAVVLPSTPPSTAAHANGPKEAADVNGSAVSAETKPVEEEEEEEELEEWEIEAERRFQDSDVDEAPIPPPVTVPAKKAAPSAVSSPTTSGKGSKNDSPIMDQASATMTPPPEQEGRRRRKLWAKK